MAGGYRKGNTPLQITDSTQTNDASNTGLIQTGTNQDVIGTGGAHYAHYTGWYEYWASNPGNSMSYFPRRSGHSPAAVLRHLPSRAASR